MAAAVIQAPAAQAQEQPPGWARPTASLHADPADIVAAAPADEPLKVVVTTQTDQGPSIKSVDVKSAAAATKVVAAAQDHKDTIGVSMAQPVRIAATGPDPLRPQQWAHDVLRVSTAWGSADGYGVTVAVIDTGVQSNHPDLYGKVLAGYDFVDGDPWAADANGHGTHVAGIIAAASNNRIGVAGITRRAKILPVRVLDANGDGYTSDVAAGIAWAVDHGAKVINLSLAGTESDDAMRVAIAYAVSKNVVVVAAAGNSGCDTEPASDEPVATSYPAAYPNVIGVASIDRNKAVSDFSSCGSWVDVAAPGEDIISTMLPRPSPGLGCPTTGYCVMSGTSMATPHVAAAAALAIEEVSTRWTASGITQLLVGTATDLGAAGADDEFGAGLINPVAMLRHINTHVWLWVPSTGVVAGSTVPVRGKLLLSDGTPVRSTPVSVWTTVSGKKVVHWVTTDASGAFASTFWLPHNVTFWAGFFGSGAMDDSRIAVSYSKVAPKWSYRHTKSKVTMTNYSRYGQTLALQKKSGSKWKTVKSTKVTKSSWTVSAGKGTWRLHSYANSKLAARTTASWKN